MRRVQHLAIVLSVIALLTGCSGSGSSDHNSVATTGSNSATGNPSGSSTSSVRYDASRDAAADIQAALKLAAADQRPVLIDFGSDWCEDCQALGTIFSSAAVQPVIQKGFHLVLVDVGNFDRNVDLAAKYVNLKTSGIPALVVLGPDGTVRVATSDGAFADAKSMKAEQVIAFLTRWASANG